MQILCKTPVPTFSIGQNICAAQKKKSIEFVLNMLPLQFFGPEYVFLLLGQRLTNAALTWKLTCLVMVNLSISFMVNHSCIRLGRINRM